MCNKPTNSWCKLLTCCDEYIVSKNNYVGNNKQNTNYPDCNASKEGTNIVGKSLPGGLLCLCIVTLLVLKDYLQGAMKAMEAQFTTNITEFGNVTDIYALM